ncbi:pilus assembly FimT family protein [Aquincola agrisoli]
MLEPMTMRHTRRHPASGASAGLTLVELMVTLVVLGVVLTLAVPAFNDLIVRERVRGVNNELIADMQLARSEAVQRLNTTLIHFKANETMSCYAVYAKQGGGGCDCLRTANHCENGGVTLTRLLKVVQIPRDSGITIGVAGRRAEIENRRGTLDVESLAVPVTSTRGPALVTTLEKAGRISTCSPNQSFAGVPACAP